MNVEHEDDAGGGRFVVRMGDDEAELAYTRVGPSLIDMQHTYVPEGARGHGVAEELAAAAFAWAREHGDRVIPSCPFVRKWLRTHPEEVKLLDAPYAESLELRPGR
jgi:predicted GNAT family acetyltransferase